MKRITLAAVFILLGMALPLIVNSPAQAIMIPLTMEDLTREADAIMIGTITEVTVGYDSNHAGIYTSVFVDVDEGLKGNVAPGAKIAISIEGGTVGHVTEWVEDEPIFTANDAGRQILVFLSTLTPARSNHLAASIQNSNYPIFQICGCFQGLATADDKWEINNILKHITPGKPTASPILIISKDWRLMNHEGSYIPDNEFDAKPSVTTAPLIFDPATKTGVPDNEFSAKPIPITNVFAMDKSLIGQYSPPTETITAEQRKEIDQVEQLKEQAIDKSFIKFSSGYVINITPEIVAQTASMRTLLTEPDMYYVIQFNSRAINKETKDTLTMAGCVLLDREYIPNCAEYIKIPPQADLTVISLCEKGIIRYVGPVPLESRLNNNLILKADANPENDFTVCVLMFEDVGDAQVNVLKNYAQIQSYSEVTHFAWITTKGKNIKEINRLNFVKWIEDQNEFQVD